MSQEFTPNNQAERLRQKIEKIKEEGIGYESTALPSRADIHRNKKNKTKWKIKFPVIRLLVLFFILLPIVIISVYHSLGTKILKTNETLTTQDNDGYEEINLNVNKDVEETETPVKEEVSQSPSNPSEHNDETFPKPVVTDYVEVELNGSDTSIGNQPIEGSKVGSVKQTDQGKSNSENLIYHTVKANETLFRIAMNYYRSQEGIKIIQQANHLQGNEIKVGQVLKIPK
ncbi:LysM peptidoglycan-binding domain-containing protein [Pseudoneobacillus sp. C159]